MLPGVVRPRVTSGRTRWRKPIFRTMWWMWCLYRSRVKNNPNKNRDFIALMINRTSNMFHEVIHQFRNFPNLRKNILFDQSRVQRSGNIQTSTLAPEGLRRFPPTGLYCASGKSRKPLKMIIFSFVSLASWSVCMSLKDSSQTLFPASSCKTTPPDST